MKTRTLRHNSDAEASVIGGVILRNTALAELETLEPGMFYDPRHRVAWEAVRNLEAAGAPIDPVTLAAEADRLGKLDALGGISFFGELALRVPTVDNVIAYAKIIEGHWRARTLAVSLSEIVERTYDYDHDADELIGSALAVLAKLDSAKPDTMAGIGEFARRRIRELEDLARKRDSGENALTGVPTGIKKLDERLGGWQYGIVNLLAARPAMGKTATAMATAQAASSSGHGTYVYSLEDSWRAYTDRALSQESGIAAERLRQGDIEPGDAQSLGHALMRLSQRRNWHLDDRSGLTVHEIIRGVRRWKSKLNIRIVIVDYLQLIAAPRSGMSEHEKLDENVSALAAAAKADDMAYLVLSQLNRDVEKRPDRRPQMSDLRGSGAIEERAKVIVGQYRGAYYGGKPKRHIDYECDCSDIKCEHTPSAEQWEREVQLLLLKNNNGQTGRVRATWNGSTTEIS